MTSVVVDLQTEAMSRSVPISDLLRKALVVARKLRVDDFREWIELELSGYGTSGDIPDYRETTGQVKAWNPYNGWIPVHFPDAETRRTIPGENAAKP